jgi:hypothetical protein
MPQSGTHSIELQRRWSHGSCRILRKPQLCGRLTALQILVKGLPANLKLPGDFCLADAHCNPRVQLHDGRGGEGLFAPLIGAPLLGQGDAFALTLMDQCPLELGKAPITDKRRLAIGESSPVKVSCSLTNSIRTPLPVRV